MQQDSGKTEIRSTNFQMWELGITWWGPKWIHSLTTSSIECGAAFSRGNWFRGWKPLPQSVGLLFIDNQIHILSPAILGTLWISFLMTLPQFRPCLWLVLYSHWNYSGLPGACLILSMLGVSLTQTGWFSIAWTHTGGRKAATTLYWSTCTGRQNFIPHRTQRPD